ncbi:MAG: saccharopine dehydrogenase NADP-binding domain-containing protein [Nakamurella sp.]
MSARSSDRDLDIVLFGATGFVGRLVAEQFAGLDPAGARIGLAGRSADRLAALQKSLGTNWPLLTADSHDPVSLDRLAGAARVVVSTVGPYAPRGLPLVLACAKAGTSYADLTGEPKFVRDSIDAAHAIAAESGAKIVHACGFDSVPSDLGVQMLAERVIADGEGELAQATLLVLTLKGGLSGGTIDSMRVGIDDVRDDPTLARRISDPYLLSPDRADEPDLGRQSNTFLAQRLPDRTWVGPFIMASFNSQIVRRSNALQGHRYGRELRYREVVRTGRSMLAPVVAGGIALGTGALAVGMRNRLTRPVLDRILPAPGEGPNEQARRSGRFRMQIRALTTTGAHYTATVAASGDPGYAATSVMLSQAALCLATDELPAGGGVLTPATAMNGVLTARLRNNGFTFAVRRDAAGN